jgi:hypothetical protein
MLGGDGDNMLHSMLNFGRFPAKLMDHSEKILIPAIGVRQALP